MYHQYFGLTEAPFSIAVNPRYLFMSARHRDALAHLLYGVGAGGGFILLTGEVGTGKTTINRCLLEQLPAHTDIAIILNPALNAIELLASVCDELGIEYDIQHTLKTLTDKLHRFLLDNHARGRKTVLLIDEAQHLDFNVLEQIRLLTNLETNSEKLLQIVLIGQPELAQMLARPELRQLNQRITARYNLDPLNLDETGAYIQHRLQVAGMSPERVIFTPSVVRGIYRATRGIPRVINVLCDRMLLGAYGRNSSRVDHSMLQLAIKEVLGEQEAEGSVWRWLVLAAAVLLLIWAGGWLLGKYTAAPMGDTTSAVSTAVPDIASAATIVPKPALDAPEPLTLPPTANSASTITDDTAVEMPVATATTTAALPATVAAGESTAANPIADAMQAPSDMLAQLWRLNSDQPVPELPCSATVQYGLACVEGEVWTWEELSAFDRPLLLDTITPERFSADILLLGIVGSSAWVLVHDDVAQVNLTALAPYWTGRYRFLWHPPAGFEKPLAAGDDSAAVAVVAQLFAELDKQPKPLTGSRFTQGLQQRVRLFQRQNGLVDDGVVGEQTLLKLNEQLGIDITAARAREQLRAAATQRSTL